MLPGSQALSNGLQRQGEKVRIVAAIEKAAREVKAGGTQQT